MGLFKEKVAVRHDVEVLELLRVCIDVLFRHQEDPRRIVPNPLLNVRIDLGLSWSSVVAKAFIKPASTWSFL